MRKLVCLAALAASVMLIAAPDAGAQAVVTPGAFCSPAGATGVTSTGLAMVCSTTAADSQLRWRQAGSTSTTSTTTTAGPTTSVATCAAAYPDDCIPAGLARSAVNCAPATANTRVVINGPIRVTIHPDPYSLDTDNDGVGCEDLATSAVSASPRFTG